MITKEQIIDILEEHTFKVYQHGDVVAKSDFDNIADCIVKNLNIPDVIDTVCHRCKSDIAEEFIPKCYCPECGAEWQTGL